MGTVRDEHDREPWDLQPGENPRLFRIFTEYITTSPRSLREACVRAWREEGRTRDDEARVPGNVFRASVCWQWTARARAFDVDRAEKARAAFEAVRLADRARRIRQLDRLSGLFDQHLAKMEPKDIKRMAPRHVVQELVRVHEASREELLDRAEDRRGEDRADVGLPALDDVVKPPSDHDYEE